ncbi:MAG: F0F1 ATP synthase subunit B [Planctomycetes bacterium]|nr:F0F1 ATP synthase subunit B [Planctomycetota bacterium]
MSTLAMSWMLAAGGGGSFNPLDISTWSSAVWTWIIFLGSLYPIWKIVFGPILGALAERDQRAGEAARAAESAQQAAEAARDAVEAELQKARTQAATLMKEARERAEGLAQERQARAEEEARAELERARRAIEQEKTRAIAEIRGQVIELSTALAERALRARFNDDNQRREVQSFVQQEIAARG